MKTLKFNSSSWHYQIAEFGGYLNHTNRDLCQYVRSFIKGVIGSLAMMCMFAIASFFVMDLIIGIGFSLVYWTMMLSAYALAFSILICLALVVTGLYLASSATLEYMRDKSQNNNKPDSFVKNAYNGWKDKFCARIEIRHD